MHEPGWNRADVGLAAVFAFMFIIGVASPAETLASKILGNNALRFLGRYSYGLYVFHHPIIFGLRDYIGVPLYPTVLGSQLPGQILFTTLVFLGSLLVAMASWHLYEVHFLKLKVKFASGARH